MIKRDDKRGQGLSTSTIVLIVLGVLILVLLIVGFTMGWDNLLPWLQPEDNVKDIANSCQIACSGENIFDYCSKKRDINWDENELEDATCYYLAEKQPLLGIAQCPRIDCDIQIYTEADLLVVQGTKNEFYDSFELECGKKTNCASIYQTLEKSASEAQNKLVTVAAKDIPFANAQGTPVLNTCSTPNWC